MALGGLCYLNLSTGRCFPRRHRWQTVLVDFALKRSGLRERSGAGVDGRSVRLVLLVLVWSRWHRIEVLCTFGARGTAAAKTAAYEVLSAADAAHQTPQDGYYYERADY
jgi:hypothetical protein